MKSPLLGGTGQVVGIAYAMYRIEHQDEWTAYLHELIFVARHIEQHFAEPIRMSDMADLVGLSFTHSIVSFVRFFG
jgi:AraC-like DNA-binding protein